MFALANRTQRLVCMLMAIVVVAGSLALGVFSSHHKTHDNYSVTITQLR